MKLRYKLLAVLSLMASFVAAQRTMIDGVVWIVGDNAILRSEVEEQRVRAQFEGTRFTGDPYCIIPEQLAIQKLFLHQAMLDSVVVSEGQVESQVNMRINYFLSEIGSKEKVEEYFGKPLSQLRDDLRDAVRDQMVEQQMQQKLVSDVTVTPAEVRRFFNRLPQDSVPMVPASVEVQIITMDPIIPVADREATKDRLREMAERVNSGKTDFTILARLYSEDEESAKQGGDLGFFGRGMMVAPFSNVAFSLSEPGKVSRVVETEFGYHIIQLVERRGDRVHCRHILLRPKVSLEIKKATITKLDSIATTIKAGNLTFEQAASQYSADKNSKMNGGLMSNEQSGSTKFELQDLPQEIAKIVNKMNVGDVSEPFVMMDRKLGREVFAVVRLRNKVDSHKANIVDDYQQLKKMCEAQKSEEIINKWIDEKISDTYIYIDPEWRNCSFEHRAWIKED
ncbi:MAG: peptidylprolyl isomerase [Paludibacteraceae bacterium]|nr:peptidylprolyl isomerase [Paludibacteraceae bacterium]